MTHKMVREHGGWKVEYEYSPVGFSWMAERILNLRSGEIYLTKPFTDDPYCERVAAIAMQDVGAVLDEFDNKHNFTSSIPPAVSVSPSPPN